MDQKCTGLALSACSTGRSSLPALARFRRRVVPTALFLAGAFTLGGTFVRAQTFTGTITGVVVDQSGAAVAGATISIRNTGTNEDRQLTSDANGRYTATQLNPGEYSLAVTASGFKSFVESKIELQGNQSAAHDAHLELGSSEQSVQVSAAALAVDTQTATRTVTFSAQEVQSLPTSFRNPLYLVHSTAGVVAVRTGLAAYMTDQNQNRFSLNGGRDESAAILVDGASIVSPDLGGAIATPTQEGTAEVQVQRTSYDAQFTHTDGGVVSLISKSGTNQLHGSAFEFMRNDVLDANTWDNNRVAIARPSFIRHQFGGSIGGPIIKNKLFIFGAYEALRQGQPLTYVTSVPTALERQGDFSQSVNADGTPVAIYNPFSTSSSDGTRTQFANNVIPQAMLNPVGVNAAALYPLPNTAGFVGGGSNFAATTKVISNYDKFDIRSDYVINGTNTMFGRLTKAWQYNSIARYFNNPGDNAQGENDFRYAIILGETWIPNARWVVNTIVSYGKWTEEDTTPSLGHSSTELGIPAATAALFQANAYPQFNVENYAQLGYSAYSKTPHETDGLQLNISHEMGSHSLKFGILAELERLYPATIASANFSFNSGLTAGPTPQTDSSTSGNSIASLLLGTGSGGDAPYQAKLNLQQHNWGAYVQDTWRASNRLTLTGGLRYEIQAARTERYNRLNTFSETATSPIASATGLPLTGGLVFNNSSNRGLWDTPYLNFDPRVSLAYKASDGVVFRAGYGIFNPNTYAYSSDASDSSDGYSSDTTWNSTIGNAGLVPQNLVSNPFPGGLTAPLGSSQGLLTQVGQQVHATLRHHPTPYLQVYSADFQVQIGRTGVLEMGYAGSEGRQLLYGLFSDLDQLPSNYLGLGYAALNAQVANPFQGVITSGALSGATIPYWRTLVKYPQFTSVDLLADTPGSSSSFNALTAKYNQRFANGLNVLLTYQWSKAIDDTSENNGWEVGDAIRDTFNHKLDRSVSAHDVPQAFVGTVIWQLPFGRGKAFGSNMHGVANSILGGWTLNTIVRMASGLPLHLSENNVLGSYNYEVTRPNITSIGALTATRRSVNEWFNTAAVETAGTADTPALGNVPRFISSLRRAPTRDTDMALEKSFALYRESQLQFRAEAYNVTNTPEYGAPDTVLGDSSFGQVTSTTSVGPRTIQIGARVQF